jgi:hypothetical protein
MVFTLQKRTVRIVAGVKSQNSCRNLFMSLEILLLQCDNIFTLRNFVVNNQEHLQTYSAIHSVNTTNMDHLYRPTANLSYLKKKKGILCWHQNLEQSTTRSEKSYE